MTTPANSAERRTLPVKCAFVSLKMANEQRPTDSGNYFNLELTGSALGLPICNFWWENLEAAKQRFLTDGNVEVLIWTDGDRKFGLIDDARIPADWYYNKMCWMSSGKPSVAVATEMFAVRGDLNKELELITDPHAYHRKRGGVYRSATEGFKSIVQQHNIPQSNT